MQPCYQISRASLLRARHLKSHSEQQRHKAAFSKIVKSPAYVDKLILEGEAGEMYIKVPKFKFSDCFDGDYEHYSLEIFSEKIESLIAELKVDNRPKVFEAKKAVRRQEMKLQQLRNEEENAKQELAIRIGKVGLDDFSAPR